MMSTLSFFWDSVAKGYFDAFEDQEQQIPMNLWDANLLLIGKKRIADTDADAILSLTIGNGLTLDETYTVVVDNETRYPRVKFQIPPMATTSLPRAKNTTIWIEVIKDVDDPELRQSIDQQDVTVKPSLKEVTE
jgi:hypothetical protein